MKRTAMDRVIEYFAPQTALRRYRARTVIESSGAYVGARSDRSALMLWNTSAGSANRDLIPDLPTLRRRSRDLDRNAPLATGAINTMVTNVVGTGLQAKPSIDRDYLGLTEEQADEWERDALREWRLWSESVECDVGRRLTFDMMQDLAYRSSLQNGDSFAVRRFQERPGSPFGTKLQLIEADRCCNPNGRFNSATMIEGVELAAEGAPLAYWFASRHPAELYVGPIQWTRVPAFGEKTGLRNVLHIMRPQRIDQVRGAPFLAPVIELLKQLTRYGDAEIMAAVINSCFAIVTKSNASTAAGGGPLVQATSTDGKNTPLTVSEPGQFLDLAADESVEPFTPGRPNGAFDPFVLAMLRQIGVALEIPYEILVKHFTASYSAARAALLEAWKVFRARRKWLAQCFCQPAYEFVLIEAVSRGRLRAPGFLKDPAIMKAYSGAEWIGPSQGMINEKDETDAALARIDGGLSTREEETARLTGGDWERKHVQSAKEKRMRVADGLEQPNGQAAQRGQQPKQIAGPNPDLPEEEDAA